MKILYFTSVDATDDTAPAVHVRGSCKAFSELGHSVALIHASGERPARLANLGLNQIHAAPWPRFRGGARIFDAAASLRLRTVEKGWKPDIVYARCGPGFLLNRTLKALSAPTVFELNGTEALGDTRFSAFISQFDMMLCDSEEMLQKVYKHNITTIKKIAVHETFVTDDQKFFKEDKLKCRSSIGIAEEEFQIIFVSTFQSWHDFNTIIDAVQILKSENYENYKFVFMGGGPEFGSVLREVNRRGLDSHIEFTGKISHDIIRTWINASDIAVDILTEDKLAQGKNLASYKLYEYAACNIPTITAVSPGFRPPDWAAGSFCIIPPGDPARLAHEIRSIRHNPTTWKARAQCAYDYVRTYRTWAAATRTTIAQLEAYLVEQRGSFQT